MVKLMYFLYDTIISIFVLLNKYMFLNENINVYIYMIK